MKARSIKARSIISFLAVIILALGSQSCKGEAGEDEVVVFETSYGRIIIELLSKDAPKHTENFKELVREGFYDGTKFHRLVAKPGKSPIAIQGGDPNTVNGDPSTWGQGQPDQKTVEAEFSDTLKHVRGTVSAARKGNDVNSASSQFFICTATEPQWDGQYTIFGRIVDGMNVVDTIARAPVWPNSERPLDPVVINKAYLARRGEVK